MKQNEKCATPLPLTSSTQNITSSPIPRQLGELKPVITSFRCPDSMKFSDMMPKTVSITLVSNSESNSSERVVSMLNSKSSTNSASIVQTMSKNVPQDIMYAAKKGSDTTVQCRSMYSTGNYNNKSLASSCSSVVRSSYDTDITNSNDEISRQYCGLRDAAHSSSQKAEASEYTINSILFSSPPVTSPSASVFPRRMSISKPHWSSASSSSENPAQFKAITETTSTRRTAVSPLDFDDTHAEIGYASSSALRKPIAVSSSGNGSNSTMTVTQPNIRRPRFSSSRESVFQFPLTKPSEVSDADQSGICRKKREAITSSASLPHMCDKTKAVSAAKSSSLLLTANEATVRTSRKFITDSAITATKPEPKTRSLAQNAFSLTARPNQQNQNPDVGMVLSRKEADILSGESRCKDCRTRGSCSHCANCIRQKFLGHESKPECGTSRVGFASSQGAEPLLSSHPIQLSDPFVRRPLTHSNLSEPPTKKLKFNWQRISPMGKLASRVSASQDSSRRKSDDFEHEGDESDIDDDARDECPRVNVIKKRRQLSDSLDVLSYSKTPLTQRAVSSSQYCHVVPDTRVNVIKNRRQQDDTSDISWCNRGPVAHEMSYSGHYCHVVPDYKVTTTNSDASPMLPDPVIRRNVAIRTEKNTESKDTELSLRKRASREFSLENARSQQVSATDSLRPVCSVANRRPDDTHFEGVSVENDNASLHLREARERWSRSPLFSYSSTLPSSNSSRKDDTISSKSIPTQCTQRVLQNRLNSGEIFTDDEKEVPSRWFSDQMLLSSQRDTDGSNSSRYCSVSRTAGTNSNFVVGGVTSVSCSDQVRVRMDVDDGKNSVLSSSSGSSSRFSNQQLMLHSQRQRRYVGPSHSLLSESDDYSNLENLPAREFMKKRKSPQPSPVSEMCRNLPSLPMAKLSSDELPIALSSRDGDSSGKLVGNRAISSLLFNPSVSSGPNTCRQQFSDQREQRPALSVINDLTPTASEQLQQILQSAQEFIRKEESLRISQSSVSQTAISSSSFHNEPSSGLRSSSSLDLSDESKKCDPHTAPDAYSGYSTPGRLGNEAPAVYKQADPSSSLEIANRQSSNYNKINTKSTNRRASPFSWQHGQHCNAEKHQRITPSPTPSITGSCSPTEIAEIKTSRHSISPLPVFESQQFTGNSPNSVNNGDSPLVSLTRKTAVVAPYRKDKQQLPLHSLQSVATASPSSSPCVVSRRSVPPTLSLTSLPSSLVTPSPSPVVMSSPLLYLYNDRNVTSASLSSLEPPPSSARRTPTPTNIRQSSSVPSAPTLSSNSQNSLEHLSSQQEVPSVSRSSTPTISTSIRNGQLPSLEEAMRLNEIISQKTFTHRNPSNVTSALNLPSSKYAMPWHIRTGLSQVDSISQSSAEQAYYALPETPERSSVLPNVVPERSQARTVASGVGHPYAQPSDGFMESRQRQYKKEVSNYY